MVIESFTCDNFHSIDNKLFSGPNENYKLKSLLAKVEVLKFLSLAFFNLK